MVVEKKLLSLEELESQTALELPERETLDTFVARCVAVCVGGIQVKNVNVEANVAAQVCAGINAALALLGIIGGRPGPDQTARVECELRQTGGDQDAGD
jgi:hypothetical protein